MKAMIKQSFDEWLKCTRKAMALYLTSDGKHARDTVRLSADMLHRAQEQSVKIYKTFPDEKERSAYFVRSLDLHVDEILDYIVLINALYEAKERHHIITENEYAKYKSYVEGYISLLAGGDGIHVETIDENVRNVIGQELLKSLPIAAIKELDVGKEELPAAEATDDEIIEEVDKAIKEADPAAEITHF